MTQLSEIYQAHDKTNLNYENKLVQLSNIQKQSKVSLPQELQEGIGSD